MNKSNRQQAVDAPDSKPEAPENRHIGASPEPESPSYDKKLDGPNRPST